MAKSKISVNDFMDLMNEDVGSSEEAAFSPKAEHNNPFKSYENTISALDSRETGVSSALDKALDSRETGVSSALDKKSKKSSGVSSALDKPLDNRETGVRQIKNSALDVGQIVGKEKSLLFIIHQECKKLGQLETNFIGTDTLKVLLSLDSLGLRNLIFRVKGKGFFEVTSKQLGRVGLRKFKINRTIYQQILSSPLDSRETGVSSALDKALDKALDGAPYSSSNDLNNITTNTGGANISAELSLPINLARFGISQNNLQKLIDEGLCNFEVVQKSVEALSFDVDQGKTGNLASILFGVLRSGKEYVSQKQAEELSKELEFELNRLKDIEDNHQKLLETRLKARYQEFLENTPNHLSEIKKRHHGLLSDNSSLLDKLAFEDFKTQLNQNIENQ